MTRLPMFLAAVFTSTLAVTAACGAAAPAELSFRLHSAKEPDQVRADFRRLDREHSQWNSTFRVTDLAGLDPGSIAAPGSAPVQFAIIRDPGRIDCAGSGGNGTASGRCRFTANRAFVDFLRTSNVVALSDEDAYAMTAVNLRRDLVAAIAEARYPAPSADDLIALAALGVDRGYVDGLAAAGYRPDRISTLIEFKALGITPEYIGGLTRLGFGRMPARQLVQFKALGVDAAYIESLRAAGYDNLAPDTLVEFKALGVTGDFIRRLRERGFGTLPPGKIVQMKALGIVPDDLARPSASKR